MAHRRDTISEVPDTKESIGVQLDVFTDEHKIRSLRDRLNVGLNEVAVLAFEKTRSKVQALCERVAGGDPDKAAQLYTELVGMSVDIQQAGPWDYAPDLNDPKSEVARLWQMLTFTLIRKFEKPGGRVLEGSNGKVLNDKEFFVDVDRIAGNLEQAAADPDAFFQEARQAILEGVKQFGVRLESFAQKEKKGGRGEKKVPEKIMKGEEVKKAEWDTSSFAPIADKFEGFMTMAVKGAEIGIVKSDDGEVFVGARGTIDNRLIESCGLVGEEKDEYDRPGSKRRIMYFRPAGSPPGNKQDVIKKVHGGFLVVLTRNLELAKSIVEAVAHKRESVRVADDCLGHTRVVQTSEATRVDDRISDEEVWRRKASFMMPEIRAMNDGVSQETGVARVLDTFYQHLWSIRGRFVYLDALEELERRRADKGEAVSELDKDQLIKNIAEKMWQKVEEVQYLNEMLDADLDALPGNIDRVIDMAGGAGDVGLGVASELYVRGRPVSHMEVVDPQQGVQNFMRTIIANLPPGLRTHFEEVAHHALEHNTGYLQEAEITPTSIVVAKHACGTLTDDIITQWAGSESPMLMAMTCCQDKACGHPARYGFAQDEWDRLTTETGWTNLGDEIARSSGNKKEQLEAKLAKGKKAMETLDGARVEYLRRHGFKAELRTTDKFPKGDVIIARRLPKNFSAELTKLEQLEQEDPTGFDTFMLRLDKLAHGGDARGMRAKFGPEWVNDDFRELTRRFETKAKAAEAVEQIDPKVAQEQREVAVLGTGLSDYLKKAGVPDGKTFGQTLKLARKRMDELKDATVEEVKTAVDEVIRLYK